MREVKLFQHFFKLWKDRYFATQTNVRWHECRGTKLCAIITYWLSLLSLLFLHSTGFEGQQPVDSSLSIQVVAGSFMEGASMMFHGGYKKRCLLTILVSQILLLTLLISEIKKSTTAKGFFSSKWFFSGLCLSFRLPRRKLTHPARH
jgi:hypothetical protein